MKLKADAELMAAHFEDSARHANEHLEQAVKLFEAEKATLLKRAEKAEGKLYPLKEKYATLVKQINKMLMAIFGRKDHTLVELPIVKLKEIFTYVERLFIGSVYSIMAVKNLKHPPRNIKDMLKQLSTVPQWVTETRKAVARGGANMYLARAKAYLLELEVLKGGFPEFKLDGSVFTHSDFAKCVTETRSLVTLIAEEIDLSKYHPAYNNDNKHISTPKDEPSELVPPRRKRTFAPDVDASSLVEGTSNFESLNSIRWQQKGQQVDEDDELVDSDQEATDEEKT